MEKPRIMQKRYSYSLLIEVRTLAACTRMRCLDAELHVQEGCIEKGGIANDMFVESYVYPEGCIIVILQ